MVFRTSLHFPVLLSAEVKCGSDICNVWVYKGKVHASHLLSPFLFIRGWDADVVIRKWGTMRMRVKDQLERRGQGFEASMKHSHCIS